ncbi:MAG: protein kinase domain-containing protein [Desulforhopalus sp.]
MTTLATGQGTNHYVLLDLIGAGGMAEVYKSKLIGQQGFEKLIVVKKLNNQVAEDNEIVSNFIDEARLAALLEHENIATIYDFGEMDGSYFIAMEYLFGKDLHSVIRRARESGKPVDVEMALLVTSRICEAMEYAHSLLDLQRRPLNIIHRDLTPHNVFITYEGKVKIIDFGIARAELFDNRTKAGVVKGKVSYMSPEQLTGGDIDHRSDIFSIAILLYEMLSGRRMYSGDTATLIRKCMEVEYEPLEEIIPALSPELYRVLHKGLEKDRNLRYQSCREMGEDIDNCLFSVTNRPSSQRLKEYIRIQFKEEFEAEKNNLFAEASRWTTSGQSLDVEKTRVESIPVSEATIVNQPILQRPRKTRAKKRWANVLAGLLLSLIALVIIYGIVLYSGNSIENDPPQPATGKKQEQTKKPDSMHYVKATANSGKSGGGDVIDRLLEAAEKGLTEQRLTIPEAHSAYAYFKRVLAIDPENIKARNGILEIGGRYARFAENALLANNIVDALSYIEKGLSVSPESSELVSLQHRVAGKKEQLISTLADQAKISLAKNNLTSPEDDCAYGQYRQILSLDAGNRVALNGIQAIGDRYALLAENSYRNLKIAKARLFVQRGLQVVPDHFPLRQLQRDLTRSKPGIFFKSLEKNVGSLLNQ